MKKFSIFALMFLGTLALPYSVFGVAFTFDEGAGTTTEVTTDISSPEYDEIVINSGTVQFTANSPVLYSSVISADYGTGNRVIGVPKVTVNSGATLSFADGVTPTFGNATTNAFDGEIVLAAGGVMVVNDVDSGANHYAYNSFNFTGKQWKLSGAGTLVKTGAGTAAMLCNSGSVVIAQDAGGWIDIQQGTLLSGGWATSINWSGNKGSVNIAEGATFNLWGDTANITLDSLTGSGSFSRGENNTIVIGTGNNTDSATYGVTNNTALFTGAITTTKGLTKQGTGTQILAGNNTYAGTTTISGGTLQFGNGGDTGKIGTGAITMVEGSTLAFNTTATNNLTDISGAGTIHVIKGAVDISDADSTFSGNVRIGAEGNLKSAIKFTGIEVDAGGRFMMNVDSSNEKAYSPTEFNAARAASPGATVGIYTPAGVTVTEDIASGDLLATNELLVKSGTGTFQVTGDNTTFTAGIRVEEGAFLLGNGTPTGSISASNTITVASGAYFGYNFGAESTTQFMNNITGEGGLLVASGTVVVNDQTPVIPWSKVVNETTYSDNSRFNLTNAMVNEGALLKFDKVMGHQKDNLTITANGTVEFYSETTTGNHDASYSFLGVQNGGSTTIKGTGTFLKTGVGRLAADGIGGASLIMAMDSEALMDIREGTFVNGGWTQQNWTNNKSDLRVATGATFDIWDGAAIRVDSLVGDGTLAANASGGSSIYLGVDNSTWLDTNGDAVTPVFNGTFTMANKVTLFKVGTGTQILAGDNSYGPNPKSGTYTTHVQNGTLQFGNGGETGKIGNGPVGVFGNGNLAFNTTRENTIDSLVGNGTITNMNSGAVTVATALSEFKDGSLNVVNNDSTISFTGVIGTDDKFNGRIMGNGVVNVATTDTSNLDLHFASVTENATLSINGGGNVTVGDSFLGTLKVTENTGMAIQYGARPWQMTFHIGNATDLGRVTPTTDVTGIIDYGHIFNMDSCANNTDQNAVAALMKNSYSAMAYRSFVQVKENVSLDFAGKFDDTQGVWVLPCDEFGIPLADAQWQALLDFGGNCVQQEKKGVELSAGYYLMDVRVADQGGGRYAMAGVADANGKTLGIGFRLNGAEHYEAMDIDPATGALGSLSTDKIVFGKVSQDYAFRGKLDIADGKTLTLDNVDAGAKTFTIDTTVAGNGTLQLTDTQNSGAKYDVNIATDGSLEIGDGLHIELLGEIGKDLVIGDNVVMDFKVSTDTTTPLVTVGGELMFGTNDIMNIVLDGEAPQGDQLLDLLLIQGLEGAMPPSMEGIQANFTLEDPDMRVALQLRPDGVYIVGGSSSALPEPGTWGLMLLGCLGLLFIKHVKPVKKA